MASVEKFNSNSVVNQLRHIERTISNPANKDIDTSKYHLNYSLIPDRGITAYDYFKKRKEQLYCYNRSDVKVMAGWVITAPKNLPKQEHELFFNCVYDFLTKRYGEDNCIQAIVHNDESGQPHLHFYFIPVVNDKKHGGQKICANDVLNRKELRNFHPDLQKHLYNNNINVNINSGITKAQGGNKSVWQLKKERQYNHDINIDNRGRW